MRRNSTSSLGALHPILFFLFVYGLSLVLALFVCRTVYFTINEPVSDENMKTELVQGSHNMDATASR